MIQLRSYADDTVIISSDDTWSLLCLRGEGIVAYSGAKSDVAE